MDNSRERLCSSPQIEEHVGLLVQNDLDIAGMDQGVVHLVPLSIAGLSTGGNGTGNRGQQMGHKPPSVLSVTEANYAFSAKPKLSIPEYQSYKGKAYHTH